MKNLILFRILSVFVLILSVTACSSSNDDGLPPVRKGSFYETDLNEGNAIVLADTIMYDVTIKNPYPEDEWTAQDLGRMDEEALANIILNAIYNGRLTAYDYVLETPMTIEQVKELESKYSRDKAARMRFVEEWYFDEKNLKFGKKVNSIMIAYETFNNAGEVRYKPGVMVYLTDKSKNPPQKDN